MPEHARWFPGSARLTTRRTAPTQRICWPPRICGSTARGGADGGTRSIGVRRNRWPPTNADETTRCLSVYRRSSAANNRFALHLNRDLETDGVIARLLGREGHAQGLLVLGEFELAAVPQQLQTANLGHRKLAAESQRRDDGLALRPAHDEGVQRAVLGGEADVASGEVFAVAFIEHGVALHRWGRAAGDLPGARAVDAFAVDRHPLGNLFHGLEFLVIRLAAVGQRNVEHQVAVAAHDIAHQVHHVLAGLVLLACRCWAAER